MVKNWIIKQWRKLTEHTDEKEMPIDVSKVPEEKMKEWLNIDDIDEMRKLLDSQMIRLEVDWDDV
jgi:hypothetical protein